MRADKCDCERYKRDTYSEVLNDDSIETLEVTIIRKHIRDTMLLTKGNYLCIENQVSAYICVLHN